jgi:type IV pilus assembly protein PilO
VDLDLRDPRVQKFILGAIFLFACFYAYYAFVYRRQSDQIDALQTRLRRIERHVERAKLRVERHNIDELKAELSSLESQLRLLERLLPKAEEVPDLLELVERKGIRAGVNSVLFEPAVAREGHLYKEQVYKVSVRGKYHNIGKFLARIGSSSRIIKTSRMIIVSKKKKEQEITREVIANFELSTFILPGENGNEGNIPNEQSG